MEIYTPVKKTSLFPRPDRITLNLLSNFSAIEFYFGLVLISDFPIIFPLKRA